MLCIVRPTECPEPRVVGLASINRGSTHSAQQGTAFPKIEAIIFSRCQQLGVLSYRLRHSPPFHRWSGRSICPSTWMPMLARSRRKIYRVARRYGIKVYVVANSPLRVPAEELIELATVKGGFDAADDWIVERIGPGDIAITADIPLADRCLTARCSRAGSQGARVHRGSHRQRLGYPRAARHAAAIR